MSNTKRQNGGGDTGFRRPPPPLPPLSLIPNCTTPVIFPCLPPPPVVTNVSTIVTTTLATILSLTSVETSTITSNVISTATTISISVLPVTLPPDPTISSALASETSLLKNNASLTKGNTAATAALGTLTVILLIAIAIFFFFWLNRRRYQKGDSETPPSTPIGPNPTFVPSIRSGLSGPFVTQEPRPATALSTGPSGQGYGAAALRSHPIYGVRPAAAKRSSSAPNLKPPSRPPRIPTLRGLPAINIMPNAPSPRLREESPSPGPVSPIGPEIPQGAMRMPEYHQALQDEAVQERSRRERETAERLGLPIVERSERRSQRASVSTIGSELERFAGGGGGNGGNTPSRQQGLLHSTRASSGVLPYQGDSEEEGGSRERSGEQ